MSPDNRTYAGGDFLIGTASDVHQLDMIARDAAVAGAALLILDGDAAQGGIRILDAAGAPAPLAKLRTDPKFRSALREAFNERAVRVADQSRTIWRSLLLDGGKTGAKERFESIVDDAAYRALTDRGALAAETVASRAFLIDPASAQSVLDLAGSTARTDLAASWPLVVLANRLARGTEEQPFRPPALDIGAGRLFVADDRGPRSSREQRAALENWLDDLPAAPREGRVQSGKLLAFPNPPSGDNIISHSVGLSGNAEGQYKISVGGALLFLRLDGASTTDEFAVVMEFLLVGEQPDGRIDVEAIGGVVRKIDLTSNLPRRVEIRARTPEDPTVGMVIKLLPIEVRWADILLTNITAQSAEQQSRIGPEALASVGFDLLETVPITSAVLTGAFGLEQDGDGRDFRWISRELVLKLPIEASKAGDDKAKSNPWLVLKLRPNPSSHPAPLAADIELPAAGGKRAAVALRRLGDFYGDVMLGGPIGLLEAGGVARITLRRPNEPLSPGDSRLAAGCLTDLWIASPADSGRQAATPRFVPLNLANGAQFADGWYALEHVKDLPSRWMSRHGLVSSGFRPRPHSKIFLALAGPWLPKANPSLVPFTVSLAGRTMTERSRIDVHAGWALLFEGESLDDTFAADFELTAQRARVLGPSDPREASILASFATVINPAGDTATTTGGLGDAAVMNCALTFEHWGGGLTGAWLPPATIMACARPAETSYLVIEGAAATDAATVEGLAVEIDSEAVEPEIAIAKDGSWTLRVALGEASQGEALLLRLIAGRKGRVMLRRVGFE
jgi:hypothetical protein